MEGSRQVEGNTRKGTVLSDTPVSLAMMTSGRELAEPRLSHDGTTVAYTTRFAGRSALVVQPVTGGPEHIVATDPAPQVGRWDGGGCFDWMPDGDGFVYVGIDGQLWRTPRWGGESVALTD